MPHRIARSLPACLPVHSSAQTDQAKRTSRDSLKSPIVHCLAMLLALGGHALASESQALDEVELLVEFVPASLPLSIGTTRTDPTGDTFSVAPLLETQDPLCGDECVFDASNPAVQTITFNGVEQLVGTNLFGGATGSEFFARGVFVEDVVPGIDRIQVEMSNRRPNGQLLGWVAAGLVAPSGDTLHTWRLDAGAFEAALDAINTDATFIVVDALVEAFNAVGASLGTFAFPNDESFGEAIGGAFLLTLLLDGEPDDIAGFDMARLRITWDLQEAIMVDNFESGDTSRWSSAQGLP